MVSISNIFFSKLNILAYLSHRPSHQLILQTELERNCFRLSNALYKHVIRLPNAQKDILHSPHVKFK